MRCWTLQRMSSATEEGLISRLEDVLGSLPKGVQHPSFRRAGAVSPPDATAQYTATGAAHAESPLLSAAARELFIESDSAATILAARDTYGLLMAHILREYPEIAKQSPVFFDTNDVALGRIWNDMDDGDDGGVPKRMRPDMYTSFVSASRSSRSSRTSCAYWSSKASQPCPTKYSTRSTRSPTSKHSRWWSATGGLHRHPLVSTAAGTRAAPAQRREGHAAYRG